MESVAEGGATSAFVADFVREVERCIHSFTVAVCSKRVMRYRRRTGDNDGRLLFGKWSKDGGLRQIRAAGVGPSIVASRSWSII